VSQPYFETGERTCMSSYSLGSEDLGTEVMTKQKFRSTSRPLESPIRTAFAPYYFSSRPGLPSKNMLPQNHLLRS